MESKQGLWAHLGESQNSNRIVAIFTIIIALTGAIYAVFAALQWCANKDAADAARNSAIQAKAANDLNAEALHSVQRAFVTFKGFQYFRIQNPDNSDIHNWYWDASFENAGSTSANYVVGAADMKILKTEPAEEQFLGTFKNFPLTGIGPKVSRSLRIPYSIPEKTIFGVDLGPNITSASVIKTHWNRHLFIWGWTYYRDVFQKTKPHVTEFCNHIIGINLIFQPTPGAVSFFFENCKAHNCDDEQCDDYQTIVNLASKSASK